MEEQKKLNKLTIGNDADFTNPFVRISDKMLDEATQKKHAVIINQDEETFSVGKRTTRGIKYSIIKSSKIDGKWKNSSVPVIQTKG